VHDSRQFKNLYHAPIKIDDYIGDILEKAENMSPAQAKDVKDILNEVAKFGLYKMTTSAKLKAAKLMLFRHMKMDDAVQLYNKYVGDWGGSATTYRFEAVKDGKVVKEIRKAPMTKVNFEIKADRTDLKEDNTYDVSCIRIRAVDENGNLLNYFNDPVILSIEGDAAIIGPEVISLSGGMGGTYVKSIGKAGKAKLTVSDNYGKVMGMTDFNIAIND
ncbi:MAG: glycoside hydrolase family 2 protein, partial [Lachnospiraceae bacterium]|nr:glycoside hydrolase family 2 protein [Lachnospiraceae bacterium]